MGYPDLVSGYTALPFARRTASRLGSTEPGFKVGDVCAVRSVGYDARHTGPEGSSGVLSECWRCLRAPPVRPSPNGGDPSAPLPAQVSRWGSPPTLAMSGDGCASRCSSSRAAPTGALPAPTSAPPPL